MSPATVVRRAGVIARRRSRLIRAASAVAASAVAAERTPATVVWRAGTIALCWPRVISAASAVAAAVGRRAGTIARRGPRVVRAASTEAAAVVRRARAITRHWPRVICAASTVTATGAAIGRCRSLTNNGRAYWKCARPRTGASDLLPKVAPTPPVVGCRSELTSRRRPARIQVLPRCGYVGPIDLGGSIASVTESTPTTVVARASDSRRCRHGLRAGWFAGTAPTAAGLATAAIGCRT